MNPFSPPRELLVFDLDGTLLDSLEGIAAAANIIRERHGHSSLPEAAVRAAIGDGARVLVQRTMPEILDGGRELEDLFEEFRVVYREESLRAPHFYPGGREFLELSRGHHRLAVLTNKPLSITLPMLEALEVTPFFERILAPENSRARKPDPAGLLGLLEDLDVPPAASVLIGDSTKDFATGHAAGVFTVGMRGGYYTAGDPDPSCWVEDFTALGDLWHARNAGNRGQ